MDLHYYPVKQYSTFCTLIEEHHH